MEFCEGEFAFPPSSEDLFFPVSVFFFVCSGLERLFLFLLHVRIGRVFSFFPVRGSIQR